jgi:phage shock protein PspC (stress-responsive transcriptional regulator)
MVRNPPRALTRSDAGRWLGGVCVGLARVRRARPAWIRAAFVAATLIGGVGILVYVACWLIVPEEGEPAEGSSSGWIVVLAQACAVCVGIVAAATFGAAATLFGFGWMVAALAAAVLTGVLVAWPRLGPAWALLPIAALTLPSLAVAAGGLHLSPQPGSVTDSPRALTPTAHVTLRAGLGTMLIDLRHTALPASGMVPLRVEGGVRRTIVALPENRCVHVALRYRVRPFVAQVAAQLTGQLPFSGAEMFGTVLNPGSRMHAFPEGPAAGPWLSIDFTSLGGSLYVRDYPDSVDPNLRPSWPGYRVFPEPRPPTRGIPRRAARRLIAAWRSRHTRQVHSQRLVDALMPGPCAATGAAP